MGSKEEAQEKLDAALEAALNDLDDDEDEEDDVEPQPEPASQPSVSRPVQGPIPPPAEAMGSIDDMMKQLMGDSGGGQTGEFMGLLLKEMQTQIGAELEQIEGNNNYGGNIQSKQTQATSPPKPQQDAAPSSKGQPDVDQAISSLIDGMANQAKLDEPTIEAPEDEMLKNMMNQLGEGLGGGDEAGFNADALIDGMMEQLLAKDLMYEPMKKVAEKFPDWLEQNKGKLPEEEYEKRRQQYQCFQKLVQAYDTEPENVQKLMSLMQEVQEFGQPPPEIIKGIAPGLELDADGLPKMDGAGGLPFPNGNEECRIM